LGLREDVRSPQLVASFISNPAKTAPIAWPLRSILRQNVNLAKLPLDLLYTLGAERVCMIAPPARYRAPAILTWYDRNGNCR
jgi:hypothetical protein